MRRIRANFWQEWCARARLARMAVAFGERRERFPDAASVQNLCSILRPDDDIDFAIEDMQKPHQLIQALASVARVKQSVELRHRRTQPPGNLPSA